MTTDTADSVSDDFEVAIVTDRAREEAFEIGERREVHEVDDGLAHEVVVIKDIGEPVVTEVVTDQEAHTRRKTFYLVWSKEGLYPPRQRLSTLSRAKKAAKNMALRHPRQKFYVVQSLFQYSVKDPTIVEKTW